MAIHLLQPHGSGLRSGGYAYNEAVGRRLNARALGGLREVSRRELVSVEFPTGCQVLIDSLFLQTPLIGEERETLSKKGVRYHLLLHLLPFDDPTARPEEKDRTRTSIESWLPLLSGVVVTGHGAAREWCHHFPNTFEPVIAPPAIIRLPRDPQSDCLPRRLLTIGTLCPRKNQHALLEILKQTRTTDWRWDLVGHVDETSAYVQEFMAELKRLQWEDRVVLHGSVSQERCDALLSQASLYVSAAKFESFGIATATALMSGVPTLTFRTGDVDRWVPDGEKSSYFNLNDTRKFEQQLLDLLHREQVLPRPDRVEVPCRTWEDTLSLLLRGLDVGHG
jgi:glycosyltransferase involved in cell wall biosynthesis